MEIDDPAPDAAETKAARLSLWSWARSNLGVLVFMTGLASGAVSTLISTTLMFSDNRHRLEDLEAKNGAHDAKEAETHLALVDVDRRINEAADKVADLKSRISVLEAQIRFFADRRPIKAEVHR